MRKVLLISSALAFGALALVIGAFGMQQSGGSVAAEDGETTNCPVTHQRLKDQLGAVPQTRPDSTTTTGRWS